jgi:lipopolysaccharide transport system permease protein
VDPLSLDITTGGEAAMTSQQRPAVITTVVAPENAPTFEITPPRGWFDLNLRELWVYRELLYFLVWRDLKVRYKQTAIGVGWVIIQPFCTMLIFSFFFGRLAKMPSDGLPYPVFYYCALLPWMYFASALTNATNTVVEQERVITKVYFPRVLLPASAVVSGLVDFSVSLFMFVCMMFYYHMTPRLTALLVPVFLLMAITTALGAGLWLSALNAIYRDVRYAIPFLVQVWMFASPVAYPSTLVPDKWRWLYGLNPMTGIIEGFRWSLTGHGHAPGPLLIASAGMVAAMLCGGVLYFKNMEGTIADRM